MNWTISQTVDLTHGYTPVVWPNALMVSGDVGAHTWRVTVLNNGVPAGLSGATITGSFLRADGNTVLVSGTVSGHIASVTLTDVCYAVEGKLVGTMRAVISGATVTLATVVYTVKLLTSGDVINPGVAYADFNIDAAPKGGYVNLAALNAANPDHNKIYITLNDNKWCYWNGTAFVAGGVYQSLIPVYSQTSVGASVTVKPLPGSLLQVVGAFEASFTGAGTKSPTNPYALVTHNSFEITANDVTTSHDVPPVAGINGVYDYVDTNGEIRRNTQVLECDGTEAWDDSLFAADGYFYITIGGKTATGYAESTHFVHSSSPAAADSNTCYQGSQGRILTVYPDNTIATDITSWRAWLAAQSVAGTPVKFIWTLAAEETETIDPILLYADDGDNVISSNAGQIEVTCLTPVADPAYFSTGSIDCGILTMPGGFPVYPFDLYRDFDAQIKHTYLTSALIANPGLSIYVNSTTGDDSGGDGSEGTPYATIAKALEVAIASAETKIVILATGDFRQDNVCPSTMPIITGKTVSIIPSGESNVCLSSAAHNADLTWSASGAAFSSTCAGVESVFDKANRDMFGIAKPLARVTSIALCQSTVNSWYLDGSTLYVHTYDGRKPDADVLACLNTHPFYTRILGAGLLYTKNCEFYAGDHSSGACYIVGADASESTYIHENCRFAGGNHGSTYPGTHGLSTLNVWNVYGFNSIGAYTGRDGLNYHFGSLSSEHKAATRVFEYNCAAHHNGVYGNTNENNNASTCHDGANILRIGTVGWHTKGPVFGDANGCYTVMYDCKAKDTLATSVGAYDYASCYYFDNAGGASGKAYLINCEGGGQRTFDLSADDGFALHVKAFKGNKINKTKPILSLIDSQ